MAYDDDEYLRYRNDLLAAVYGLHENEISADDIHEIVDQALDDCQD